MSGTVRRLPPVGPIEERSGNEDHPMRRVTVEMAAGGAFGAEHARIVQALFDEMAAGWDATHDIADRRVALEDLLARGGLPPGRLVELGAGTGIGTRVIARQRPLTAAVDLSAGMLAQAPQGLAPWVRADAGRLPFPDHCVDVLVLLNMLLFPAEVDRVLAPTGALAWVNTMGEATPIHLTAQEVVDALPGRWSADASRAGPGTWCVARRGEGRRPAITRPG